MYELRRESLSNPATPWPDAVFWTVVHGLGRFPAKNTVLFLFKTAFWCHNGKKRAALKCAGHMVPQAVGAEPGDIRPADTGSPHVDPGNNDIRNGSGKFW